MKRDISTKYFALLTLIVFFGSCRSKRDSVAVAIAIPTVTDSNYVATHPESLENGRKTEKLVSIAGKQARFATFSGKAKASLNIGTNSNDVTMNIRIKHQEAIWVSVTAIAGLEVARALITPDSVKVINRLENEYINKPFSYLYEFTNSKINFDTIEALLVGNTISGFINDSTEVNLSEVPTVLKSLIETMAYSFQVNSQDKVVFAELSDESAGQSLMVNYGDFQLNSQQQVAHSVMLKSFAKDKRVSLDLKFSKVELDALVDMPFRAPDRFTIKN